MAKQITSSLLILAMVLLLVGCTSKEEYKDQVIFGMDTYTTVRIAADGISNDEFAKLCEKCSFIIATNEKLMSAYDESSQIYAFNNGAGMILSPDAALLSVLSTAENISSLTDGAYLHTIGALSLLWNVAGGGYVPADSDIEAALDHVSTDGLSITKEKITHNDSECKVDLGGIAKGHTVQSIIEYLASEDVEYGLVSMGSSIGVFGEKDNGEAFKVGITDPADSSKVAGYLSIKSGFISVSGGFSDSFTENGKTYHHILDSKTGRPSESGLASVAVWCQSGAVSDALSTALFVMGEKKAMELYSSGVISFEAVFITEDGEVVLTDGIADGKFELENESYVLKNPS